jgi:Na+/proline symporter
MMSPGPEREQQMKEFFRSSLTRPKLEKLFVSTALGNFAGYASGSIVTVICTYHSVERRAIRNMFGLLPRKSVVVHLLPEWAEWVLGVVVGFLVMEFVRYVINREKPSELLQTEPAENASFSSLTSNITGEPSK